MTNVSVEDTLPTDGFGNPQVQLLSTNCFSTNPLAPVPACTGGAASEPVPGLLIWTFPGNSCNPSADTILTMQVEVRLNDNLDDQTLVCNHVKVEDDQGDVSVVTGEGVPCVRVDSAALHCSKRAFDALGRELPEGSTVQPGTLVSYAVDVWNAGDRDANAVIVSDLVPSGESYQSGSGQPHGYPDDCTVCSQYNSPEGILQWQYAHLQHALLGVTPPPTKHFEFDAQVAQASLPGSELFNLVTVSDAAGHFAMCTHRLVVAGGGPCDTDRDCLRTGGGVCLNGRCTSSSSGCAGSTFAPPRTVFSGENPTVGLAAGSFAGDSRPDLAVALNDPSNIEGPGSVAILRNDGNAASFSPVVVPVPGPPFGLATGDFDASGTTDIVTANRNDNSVSVLLNDGSGGVTSYAYPAGNFPMRVTAGDFDSDGKPDIAALNTSDDTVTVFFNDGNGSFATRTFPAISAARVIAAADYDGDGRLDIVMAGGDEGNRHFGFLINQQQRSSMQLLTFPFLSELGSIQDIAVGDLNGDGRLDVALAQPFSVSVILLTGNYSYTLLAPIMLPDYSGDPPPPTNATGITTGDFDGDGDLDLAVASRFGNNVFILSNDGNGNFADVIDFPGGEHPSKIVSGDFNGDGWPDLATSNEYSVSLLLNGCGDVPPPPPTITPTPGLTSDGCLTTTKAVTQCESACGACSSLTSPAPGATLTYKIEVHNGNAQQNCGVAPQLTVTDPLPPGETYVACEPAQSCGYDGTDVRFSLGDLQLGATVQMTVTTRIKDDVANGTILENRATAEAQNQQVSQGLAQVTVQRPVLSLSQVGSPNPVQPGGSVVYAFYLSNMGANCASGVTIQDILPSNAQFVQGSESLEGSCSASGFQFLPNGEGFVVSPPFDLPAGGSCTGQFQVLVPQQTQLGQAVTNRQRAIDLPGDVVLATTSVLVNTSLLQLSNELTNCELPSGAQCDNINAPAGSLLTYHITATAGPYLATGVVVTDALPSAELVSDVSTTCPSYSQVGGVLQCRLGSIAPGASASFDVVVRLAENVVPGTIISNLVTATDDALDQLGAANTVTSGAPIIVGSGDAPFVPPNLKNARCEAKVTTEAAALLRCATNCQVKLARATAEGQPFDFAACLDGQNGRALRCRARFDRATAKLVDSCPPCLDGTAQASLADQILEFVKTSGGRNYCAGSISLAPDSEGFVPADSRTASCEHAAARSAAQMSRCVAHCDIKQATAAVRGVSFDRLTCTESENSRPASCRHRFDQRSASLATRRGCPDCLNLESLNESAEAMNQFMSTLQRQIYCAGATPLP